MFRPTNITNQTKFPVYHTTLQSATLWFCWQTTFGLDGKNTFYSFNFESTQARTTFCFLEKKQQTLPEIDQNKLSETFWTEWS